MRADLYNIPLEVAKHAILDCHGESVDDFTIESLKREWRENLWREDNYCKEDFAESHSDRLMFAGLQYKGGVVKAGKRFKPFVEFERTEYGDYSMAWTRDGDKMLGDESVRCKIDVEELRLLYKAFYAAAFNVVNGVTFDFPLEAVFDAYLTALHNPECASLEGVPKFERIAKKNFTRMRSMMFPSHYVNARSAFTKEDLTIQSKFFTVVKGWNTIGRPESFYRMTMEERERERKILLGTYVQTQSIRTRISRVVESREAAAILYDASVLRDAESKLPSNLVIKPHECRTIAEFESTYIHDHRKYLEHAWKAYKMVKEGLL